jgi:lipopolysaccharide/colanic/teichoic acid biosynthesis glycosyltransferase
MLLTPEECRLPTVIAPLSAPPVQYVLKRVLDYTIAATALIVFAPLMLFIALAVGIESRGPVFFRQPRMGRRGEVFRIWKFRTMIADAERMIESLEAINESEGRSLFKLRSDPRVTRLGRFLRQSSLDELPQLFNILAGQMSLVGPRPLPLRDCALLTERDPEGFRRRFEVMPGLTGLWQVSGRSRLGGEKMIALDCEYIDRWSVWRDVVILFRTFGVLLFDREGAC